VAFSAAASLTDGLGIEKIVESPARKSLADRRCTSCCPRDEVRGTTAGAELVFRMKIWLLFERAERALQ
jgi:hypothetical protein